MMFFDKFKKNFGVKKELTLEEMKEKIKTSDYVFSYTKGTFNPSNKNYKTITLVDDCIVIDDNGNVNIRQDEALTKKMWLSITVNTDLIMRCSQETRTLPHIKDGSKDELILKQKDKTYLFSGKITDEKYKKAYDAIISKFMEILVDDENLKNYEKMKSEDHILVSSWYGKKEVGIQEKLITFQKGNAGYVYVLEKKMGYENEVENKTKITKICRLDPILLVELKRFIIEEEKLFDKTIQNGVSMDRGTKISIQLDGKKIVICDVAEYYTKISNKINEIIENHNAHIKEVENKIDNTITNNKEIISKEELNEKFKTADKNVFYLFGSMAMKDYKIIRLVENYIAKEEYIKGQGSSKIIIDESIATKVWDIINSRIEEIKQCSIDIEKMPRIVDGNNDSIIVKVDNKSYGFSSKTEDKNIQEIYKEISTEILKYLDI